MMSFSIWSSVTRAAGGPERPLLERPGDLPDAVARIHGRPARDRIVIDHRAQDERVVGVHPEGELPVPVAGRHLGLGQ